MRETHLLDEDWSEARFQRIQDTLLVVAERADEHEMEDDYDCAMVAFDLRSRRPLGPVRSLTSPVHLCELPLFRPEPVLASTAPGALIITDVRDGSVLKTFPVSDARRKGLLDYEYDLALGRHDGRDLLFLHEVGEGTYGRVWWATDLTTGAPVPGMFGKHLCYTETSGRLTLRHGYLAHPTTREVVEFWPDDFHVINASSIDVFRAEDGDPVGSVRIENWVPEEREVDIAHAAGRTYLAEAGDIFTLPELEPALPQQGPWVAVSRVSEWGGRPVAVLVEENYLRKSTAQLSYLFLDVEAPEKIVIPWSAPPPPPETRIRPQVDDLLVTPEGTIVISSIKGVHVIDIDPEEAARSGRTD